MVKNKMKIIASSDKMIINPMDQLDWTKLTDCFNA